MIFNLFNKRKAKFEKSCELSALASLEILNGSKGSLDKALELYQQAILICPENPLPYWNVIDCLHGKKRDAEAFNLFEKVQKLDYQIILSEFKDNKWLTLSGAMPVLAIVRPSVIGMLIFLNKIDLAKTILIQELERLHMTKIGFDYSIFGSSLGSEMLRLSINDSKRLINLLAETVFGGYLSNEKWQLIKFNCINNMGLKIRYLLKENKFSEALEGIDFILSSEIKYSQFINRDELIKLQKSIPEEIEEAKKWDLNRSNNDFLRFLFKRLAFKFHPDLATDENDKIEKTKIMQEINRDKEDMQKLENIVNKHMPEWSKYIRKRKQ